MNKAKIITVLGVEDEVLVRDVMVEHLTEAGFAMIEAGSAEAAVAILADGHDIDVVFTDIRLGGKLNGWDVGEHARSRSPDMPVIYASGCSIAPPRNVPGSMFFNKPYHPGDVLDACRKLSAA